MHLLARHYHPTLQRGHQDARGGKSPGRRHTAQLGLLALAGVRRRAEELLPCLRARKLCLRTWLGPVQPAREGLGRQRLRATSQGHPRDCPLRAEPFFPGALPGREPCVWVAVTGR